MMPLMTARVKAEETYSDDNRDLYLLHSEGSSDL
jgi:hypothetical protein